MNNLGATLLATLGPHVADYASFCLNFVLATLWYAYSLSSTHLLVYHLKRTRITLLEGSKDTYCIHMAKMNEMEKNGKQNAAGIIKSSTFFSSPILL